MAKTSKKSTIRLADCDEFVRLAKIACESSSRFEDSLVDYDLERCCREALDKLDDSDIEAALAELKNDAGPAYDELLAIAEDCAETIDRPGDVHLLVLIPILAWSRYRIRFGEIESTPLVAIANAYREYFASPSAKVTMGNCLISAEHIPEQLYKVRMLLNKLIASGNGHGSIVDVRDLLTGAPPADFSDTRYLVAVVSASSATELFHSRSETYEERARACMNFCMQCHNALAMTMIGSVFDVQPPAAFFSAWRQSETAMRVYALKSLVSFVECMGFSADQLIVTTAIFTRPVQSDTEPNTELRIGVSLKKKPDATIAGIVWPVLDDDVEQTQTLAGDILSSCAVTNLIALDQTFPMEWCEDCGAPVYATPNGLVTHIEAPDEDATEFAPTLN